MSSRFGDRVPSGVGAEVDRGSVGTVAPATGTARVVIGMAAMLLAVVSFVLWVVVSREADGLLLLVTIFVAVWFWAAGVYKRKFWSA